MSVIPELAPMKEVPMSLPEEFFALDYLLEHWSKGDRKGRQAYPWHRRHFSF
jgi:hypothetical protein